MQPSSPGVPRWLAPTGLALAGAWAVGWTLLGQAGGWLAAQVVRIVGYELPTGYWPGLTVLLALLAGAPAALAAVLIHRPVLRGLARKWTLAAAAAAVLGLVRLLPNAAGDFSVSLAGALVAGVMVLLLRRRRPQPPRTVAEVPRAGGIGSPAALAVGLAGTLPWWWTGALGGFFDVVAALLAALTLGALLAWLHSPRVPVGGPIAGLIVDALIVAVPLTLLAGAAGPPGSQLALLVALPAACVAVAATDPRRRWPAALLVAAAGFGPLALLDGEEVNLLLLPDDVPRWAAIGAALSGLTLFVAGIVAAVIVLAPVPARRLIAATVAVVVAVAGAGVWFGAGSPGFHGDRLFVVLESQAKLTAATGSPSARRAAVYSQLTAFSRRTQAPLLDALRKVGAHPASFFLVNAVEVDDDPVVRALLAGRDDVASVRPNPELRPIPAAGSAGPASVAGLTGTPANLVAIKAPQAWSQGANGKGLVVGFSDSGVDVKHPALSSGYRNEWYDPWNHTATPTDRNGHGTHTAAGAVGRGTGVAPGAGWIGCADLARPLGNPAYYVSCLQFMLAPHGDPARGADILSNSWGCPSEEGCAADTLKPAVDALHAAGVFVVGAAGNTGPHCDSITDPPAPYAQTFTVGASNDAGVVTDFSSRGPVSGNAKPDLVAPGEDVLSAWPGGGYKRLSGTSMAAPQVAGVVALMWQAAPSLRGDVTRTASLLRTSAQRASSSKACGGKLRNVVGAGMVDAATAVTLAKQTAVPAPR